MPQSKSSAKRLRQSIKRREKNRAQRSALKSSIRGFEENLQAGNRESAGSDLNDVYSRLDKAVLKGVVKKNYAARKKSRLSRKLKTASDS